MKSVLRSIWSTPLNETYNAMSNRIRFGEFNRVAESLDIIYQLVSDGVSSQLVNQLRDTK